MTVLNYFRRELVDSLKKSISALDNYRLAGIKLLYASLISRTDLILGEIYL